MPCWCSAAAWADDRRGGLGLAVEHEHADALALGQLDQRLVAGAGRLDLARPARRDTSRAGSLGAAGDLVAQHRRAGRVADHQHPVAGGRLRAAVGGQRGAQQVPGHEQDGGAEHHEAGQQGVADEQLEQRDADGRRGDRAPMAPSSAALGERGSSGRPMP